MVRHPPPLSLPTRLSFFSPLSHLSLLSLSLLISLHDAIGPTMSIFLHYQAIQQHESFSSKREKGHKTSNPSPELAFQHRRAVSFPYSTLDLPYMGCRGSSGQPSISFSNQGSHSPWDPPLTTRLLPMILPNLPQGSSEGGQTMAFRCSRFAANRPAYIVGTQPSSLLLPLPVSPSSSPSPCLSL